MRFAANRFGRIVWFSARHLFQACTPCFSRAKCSLFAIAQPSSTCLATASQANLPISVIGQIRPLRPAQASAASSGPVSRQASGTVR